MQFQETKDSYRKHFASPEGAYTYLLINSLYPEFLAISKEHSNILTTKLEQLKTINSFDEAMVIINNLDIDALQSSFK